MEYFILLKPVCGLLRLPWLIIMSSQSCSVGDGAMTTTAHSTPGRAHKE